VYFVLPIWPANHQLYEPSGCKGTFYIDCTELCARCELRRSRKISDRKNSSPISSSISWLYSLLHSRPEPVFVNLFKEPRNRFPAWRAGYNNPFDVYRPARNRFLGSLKVYKFGLSFSTFLRNLLQTC
jgi:hypothetical protein